MSDHPSVPVPYTLSDDDLVRINRAILVASVVRGTVHSVNNILQTIGGQAEMLTQRPEASEDVARRAERIVAQTGRAAGYMRELSALGRELPAAPDRADVRQCVDRVYALREYDLQRGSIAFDVRAGTETLPAARIDQPALAMILLNVILNAEHALLNAPGGRITLVLASAGGRVGISVRDNGPGVAADARNRVFDPFFTTGAAGATLGLGLTAARHLAVQHGGRLILVDDAESPGARFDLDLPALG